jgi:hypothetical protein
MVEVFLGQCPKLLGDIHDSILHGDCVALVRAAHNLKASLDRPKGVWIGAAGAEGEAWEWVGNRCFRQNRQNTP